MDESAILTLSNSGQGVQETVVRRNLESDQLGRTARLENAAAANYKLVLDHGHNFVSTSSACSISWTSRYGHLVESRDGVLKNLEEKRHLWRRRVRKWWWTLLDHYWTHLGLLLR
jgi:hypothetical protein